MECSDGVCMLGVITWDPKDADLQVFCDAMPTNLGFYCLKLNAAFISSPKDIQDHTILYQESLCIISCNHLGIYNPSHTALTID